MNDEKTKPLAVAGGIGSKPGTANLDSAGGAGPQPPASVGQLPVAAAKSPAAFGGHKGGGKKRLDGIPAGTAEAEKVDKANEALRMFINRARDSKRIHDASVQTEFNERLQKILPVHRQRFVDLFTQAKASVSTLPPPLSLPASAGGQASAPVLPAPSSEPAPVAGPSSGASAVLPTFVAWTHRMLERPVKLLTKIFDRLRVGALMQRLKKLELGKDVEQEAEKRFRYKDEQLADFNNALTNCCVVELNKHQIGGAQHSHWVEVALTGGELILCHMDTVDWLEKRILEKAEMERRGNQSASPANN